MRPLLPRDADIDLHHHGGCSRSRKKQREQLRVMKQPEVVVWMFIDPSADLTGWCNNLQDLWAPPHRDTCTFTPVLTRLSGGKEAFKVSGSGALGVHRPELKLICSRLLRAPPLVPPDVRLYFPLRWELLFEETQLLLLLPASTKPETGSLCISLSPTLRQYSCSCSCVSSRDIKISCVHLR